jgi:hypothetical protein
MATANETISVSCLTMYGKNNRTSSRHKGQNGQAENDGCGQTEIGAKLPRGQAEAQSVTPGYGEGGGQSKETYDEPTVENLRRQALGYGGR